MIWTVHRPVVIPLELLKKEVKRESVGAGVAGTVSGADDFAANISSIDVSVASSTSSGEENMEVGVDTEDDEVSMDELEVAEASSESTLLHLPVNLYL